MSPFYGNLGIWGENMGHDRASGSTLLLGTTAGRTGRLCAGLSHVVSRDSTSWPASAELSFCMWGGAVGMYPWCTRAPGTERSSYTWCCRRARVHGVLSRGCRSCRSCRRSVGACRRSVGGSVGGQLSELCRSFVGALSDVCRRCRSI